MGLCVATILACVGAIVARPMVEAVVEERLAAALSRRGITAHWRLLDWRPLRGFRIEGFRLDVARLGIDAQVEQIVLGVPFRSILAGEPDLGHISARGVRATIDIAQLGANKRPGAASRRREAGRLLQRLMDNPPLIEMLDTELRLVDGDRALAVLSSAKVQVDLDQAAVVIRASVKSTHTDARLIGLAGSGAQFDALLLLETASRELELSLDGGDSPLLDLHSPQLDLRLGGATARLNLRDHAGSVELHDLSAQLGGSKGPVGGTAALLVIAQDSDRQLSAHATNGTLRIRRTPALLATLKHLKGLARKIRKARPGLATAAQATGAAAFDRLWPLWLTASEMTIELIGGPAPIKLARHFEGGIRRGIMWGNGQTAGGRFDVVAELLPGTRLPHSLLISTEGLDLRAAQRLGETAFGWHPRLPFTLDGTVSGQLHIAPLPTQLDSPLSLSDDTMIWARGRLRDGTLEYGPLAKQPLTGLQLDGLLDLRLYPEAARVEVVDSMISSGPIVTHFAAQLTEIPTAPLLVASTRTGALDCQKAFDALPHGLMGPYDRAKLSGRIKPELDLSYPLRSPYKLEFDLRGIKPGCVVKALNARPEAWPKARFTGLKKRPPLDDVGWLNKPFVLPVREGVRGGREVLVGPGTRSYVPLDALPGYVGGAAYLSEEMGFYNNHALSVGLIRQGIRVSLARGRFAYGGSTVTQQLVKNLFLTRRKTLARKLREVLIAARITRAVTRDRVLELYLNCIEFGPNIYGVGRAAPYYFDKPAPALDALESIFLAMIKPRPSAGYVFKRKGHSPDYPYWLQRTQTLFERLIDRELLTQAQAEALRPYVLRWDQTGKYRGNRVRTVDTLKTVYD